MKQHLLCVLIGLALVGGCARNHQQARTASDVGEMSAGSFARSWDAQLDLKNDPADRMYVRDDNIFVYTKGNVSYALNRSGGQLKFINPVDVSGGVLHPPVIMGNAIVYPCGSTIEVYNNRGRPVKTIPLEKPTRSGAIAIANNLYIGLDHTGGTGVIASINVDRVFRWVNWELMTFGAATPTPATFDKIIFYASEDGDIGAVTEERRAVWPLAGGVFKTQGQFVSDVKADEFGVYAANTDSKLYCLDRVSGKIKWQYYAGVPLKESPVVTATMVYQFVRGQGIVAMEKTTGGFNHQPKWNVRDAAQVLSEDEKHVYLRGRDNRIMAVDRMSGQVQFTSQGTTYQVFATNLKDATIYAATRDGRVAAIRPVLRGGEVGTVVMAE